MNVINPVESFYPVVRLELTAENENILSREELEFLYDAICRSLVKASEPYGSKPNLELSIYSIAFFDNIARLANKYSEQINFAVASVANKQEIEDLRSLLGDNFDSLYLFSPAIVENLYQYSNYYPGVFLDRELELLEPREIIKVFPVQSSSAADLRAFMRGPFPELKFARNESKLMVLDQALKDKYSDKLKDKIVSNDTIKCIKSPYEFLQYRSAVSIDANLRLLLLEPNEYTESCGLDTLRAARVRFPESKILATGIKDLFDLRALTDLYSSGADLIGSGVFKNIFLDLLAASITLEEAETMMQKELEAVYALLKQAQEEANIGA